MNVCAAFIVVRVLETDGRVVVVGSLAFPFLNASTERPLVCSSLSCVRVWHFAFVCVDR